MGQIGGVVLAAGASRRLGQPKQLLQLGGKPALQYVIDAAKAAGLDPLLVVLGHAADTIQQHIDVAGCTVLLNPDYAAGQSTSVRTALDHLPEDVEAVVFLLGDQPLVEPAVIQALVAAFRETRAPIVQPRYAEGRGNPVLIARALFPELQQLEGDTGARPVIERHRDRVHLVDLAHYHRPADLDTWEDYEHLRQAFAHRGEAR